MLRSVVLISVVVSGLAILVAPAADAKSRHLGSTKLAHHENDLDWINSSCKPRVNAIQLRVKKGQAEVESVWVKYGDGSRDTLNVRERIKAGGESRWIDLQGGKRCVTGIGIVGDTERSLDRARVDVYGRF